MRELLPAEAGREDLDRGQERPREVRREASDREHASVGESDEGGVPPPMPEVRRTRPSLGPGVEDVGLAEATKRRERGEPEDAVVPPRAARDEEAAVRQERLSPAEQVPRE